MAAILVLSFSPIRSDPRVMRQIRALSGRHAVVSCGFGSAPAGVREHLEIALRARSLASKALAAAELKLGRFESFYWSQGRIRLAQAALRGRAFDLVLANDLEALPLALAVAGAAPVLFDAHEYAPLEYEDSAFWRFFFASYKDALCRKYLRRAAMMSTVCAGIAERYAAEYGVKPRVITNAAPSRSLPAKRTDPARIRMVHHGAAIPSRRTELMIELMDHVDDRYSLDLLLVPGDARYIRRLQRLAAGRARVRFLPPVAMDELVAVSAAYDLGLFVLPPTNFNYRMALPNKFFEFIQARLGIVIGPSPEMTRLAREYDCGVVGEDFDPRTLGERLRGLTAGEVDRMKAGADRAARVLNAEANEAELVSMVDALLKGAA